MRHILLGALLLAAALAPTAKAATTSPAGSTGVRVYLDGTALHVTGAAHTGPLTVTLTGIRPASIAIIELAPGHTAADVGDVAGIEDPRAVEKIGRLVAGGTVSPGRPYTTTITAHEREYVAVDVTDEDGPRVTFSATPPAGTATPHADARVVITDDGFKIPGRLPAHGVVRVDNGGSAANHALALRIHAGLSTKQAIRLVTRSARPMKAGTPVDLVGLVSAGTTNHVQVHLRPGRYLLLSFTGKHAYAVARVR